MRTARTLAAFAVVFLPAAVLIAAAPSESPSEPAELKASIRPDASPRTPEKRTQAPPCCLPDTAPDVELEQPSDVIRVADMMRDRAPRPVLPVPVDDAAEALTRIAVSEANFGVTDDELDAIALIAHNGRALCEATPPRGRSPGITQCELDDGSVVDVDPRSGVELPGRETLLSVLRRLSPRTTVARTDFEMTWRVRWITTLPPPGSVDAPAGWIDCDVGQPPRRGECHGRWSAVVDELEDIRRRAAARIARRPANPCNGRPVTWGGSMDLHIIDARNARRELAGLPLLERLDCGDTANHVFGFARAPAAGESERSEPSPRSDEALALVAR